MLDSEDIPNEAEMQQAQFWAQGAEPSPALVKQTLSREAATNTHTTRQVMVTEKRWSKRTG